MLLKRRFLGSFLLLSTAPSALAEPVAARTCVDYATQPQWRGTVASGNVPDFATAPGLAYVIEVAQSDWRLTVLDVSDPAAVGWVGHSESFEGSPRRIEVEGDRAYVLEDSGMRILDILNPAAPHGIGFLATSTAPLVDLAPAGDWVYITRRDSGLAVVDVRDPTTPLLVHTVERSAERIGLSGQRAATIRGGNLAAYDLSDPAHPRFLGETSHDGGTFQDVAVRDNRAYALGLVCAEPGYFYCCTTDMSLRTYDIDEAPSESGFLSLGHTVGRALALEGDHAFIAANSEVQVVDIADPASPRLVHAILPNAYRAGDRPPRVTRGGGHRTLALLINSGAPSRVVNYDVTNVTRPHGVDATRDIGLSIENRDAHVAGDFLYVARETNDPMCSYPWDHIVCQEIQAYDLSAPDTDQLRWSDCYYSWDNPAFVDPLRDLEGIGNNLYLGSGTPVGPGRLFRGHVLDGHLETPVEVALPNPATDSAPSGSRLLVAMGSAGLAILDTDANDEVTATLPQHDVRRIDADGALAVGVGVGSVSTTVDFRLIDVSNPDEPEYVGELPWAITTDARTAWVALEGTVAAIGHPTGSHFSSPPGKVRLLDVSNPTSPVVASTLELPAVRGDLAGSILYLALGSAGLGVVDVRDPYAPVFVGLAATDYAVNVRADARRVVVCDRGGLRPNVFPVDCRSVMRSGLWEPRASSAAAPVPAQPSLRSTPNPFSKATLVSFHLPEDAHVSLQIFDVRGRHVRTLANGRRTAGQWNETWDGLGSDAREASAGVYFVRLLAGTRVYTSKLVRQP